MRRWQIQRNDLGRFLQHRDVFATVSMARARVDPTRHRAAQLLLRLLAIEPVIAFNEPRILMRMARRRLACAGIHIPVLKTVWRDAGTF